MRYRKWFIILTALLVLALLAGCSSGGGTETPPTVDSAAAEQPAAASGGTVRATGEVVPATYTTLSFATGGQIDSVMVEVGDTVEAGDTIAQLDTADLDMAILQAQAALASAQADLEKTKAGPPSRVLLQPRRAFLLQRPGAMPSAARLPMLTSREPART